jgi:hypothetical protein
MPKQPNPPFSAAQRRAALMRIQRFLNTRQDQFDLDAPLEVNGKLDEATRRALDAAHENSATFGDTRIPHSRDGEQGLQQLDKYLQENKYHYDLARMLDRYPDSADTRKETQWWNALAALLKEKGAKLPPAAEVTREQLAAILADSLKTNENLAVLGWARTEGEHLPKILQDAIQPLWKKEQGIQTVRALDGHIHIKPTKSIIASEPTVITYNFMVPPPSSSEAKRHMKPQMLSEEAQALFKECLQEYEAVCGVKFQHVQLPQRATLQIYVDDGRAKANKLMWHGNVPVRRNDPAVYVLFNKETGVDVANPDHARWVMLHEIGHTLGMKHTHSTPDKKLADGLDNTNTSVMSYRAGTNQPMSDSPMGLDIGWLQEKWGKPVFPPINAARYHVRSDSPRSVRRTLVDHDDAVDWLDASDRAESVRLDLRPGVEQHSRIGAHRVWIAPGSKIEGAIGGAGDDVLIASGGENYLKGGPGKDRFEIGQKGHHRVLDMQAEDVLAIGDALRSQQARYVEQPWGVQVVVGEVARGRAEATKLDIVTKDKHEVLEQLKRQMPELKHDAVLQMLKIEMPNPAEHIPVPTYQAEIIGNERTKSAPVKKR